jgi:hypothetical protein
VIEEVAADVWRVPGDDLRLPGGVRMPLASTVFRVADRKLVVYSPIAFSPEAIAAIEALGAVAHIIAPSRLHHMHVTAAAERWPDALVHAAPGVAAKRKDLDIDHELPGEVDPALEAELIGGAPAISECVVFHRATGTLACADFVFNVTRPANARTRFVLALMGAGGRTLRQSRFWRFARRDRAAARASIDRLLGWPIARVVPCHGEPCEIGAAELAPKLSRAYGGKVVGALAAG